MKISIRFKKLFNVFSIKYITVQNILLLAFVIFLGNCYQFYIMPMVSNDSALTLVAKPITFPIFYFS